MKRMLVGAIIAGAILSSGCATITNTALANRGARSGAGGVMTFQKGPTYGMGAAAQDYHSLADVFGRRPSPGGPLGLATPPSRARAWGQPIGRVGGVGRRREGFPRSRLQAVGAEWLRKELGEVGARQELRGHQQRSLTNLYLSTAQGSSGRWARDVAVLMARGLGT